MFDRWAIRVARWFLFGGTKFFFGLGQGPSKGEQTAAGAISSLGSFDTSQGTGDITSADNFWNAILSGNQGEISKALGPEFSAIAGQANQEKATTAAFGNRSGGTNAAIQSITEKTRAADTGLTESLITHAADTLGSHGENLLSQAGQMDVASFNAQDVIHGQHASQISDIFNSITSLATSLFGGGGGGGTAAVSDASSVNSVLSDAGIPTGSP